MKASSCGPPAGSAATLARVRINVTSYNRQVLLTGEVPNAQDKQLVEQVVSRVENVVSVVNELAILDSPSLMERSSDLLVTGRVKAMLLDARDLQSNAFKVVTERGTTYLMGRVTQREADRATEVVRATPGVQKVIRLLEIISEEELARIRVGAAPPSRKLPPPSRPAIEGLIQAGTWPGDGACRKLPFDAAAIAHSSPYFRRLIRLDVSQRRPPMACTSA